MAEIIKVGVAWDREFKGGKEGIKIIINSQIYIAYKNTKKTKKTDPHYVVVKFQD